MRTNNGSYELTKRLGSELLFGKLIFIAFVILSMPATLASNRLQAQEPKTKQEAKPEAVAQAPKVLAVEFYADWCTACKVLMPRIAEARTDLNGKSVLFIFSSLNNSPRLMPVQIAR